MSENVLPDCTTRERRGQVWTEMGWMVPIYCGNCGTPGGLVTERSLTFAFWLCNPCYESGGSIDGTYVVPDAVFHRRMVDEQMEKYGRILTEPEIKVVADANSSPLATLIREGRRMLRGKR